MPPPVPDAPLENDGLDGGGPVGVQGTGASVHGSVHTNMRGSVHASVQRDEERKGKKGGGLVGQPGLIGGAESGKEERESKGEEKKVSVGGGGEQTEAERERGDAEGMDVDGEQQQLLGGEGGRHQQISGEVVTQQGESLDINGSPYEDALLAMLEALRCVYLCVCVCMCA